MINGYIGYLMKTKQGANQILRESSDLYITESSEESDFTSL
jgi:hypothetical protein